MEQRKVAQLRGVGHHAPSIKEMTAFFASQHFWDWVLQAVVGSVELGQQLIKVDHDWYSLTV